MFELVDPLESLRVILIVFIFSISVLYKWVMLLTIAWFLRLSCSCKYLNDLLIPSIQCMYADDNYWILLLRLVVTLDLDIVNYGLILIWYILSNVYDYSWVNWEHIGHIK